MRIQAEFVERLQREEHAPILQTHMSGRYRYIDVTPYSAKWLKRDKKGRPRRDEDRVQFEPSTVWTEDRWMFVRRMAGYEFCQKFFYQICAFVWRANDIPKGEEI